MKDVFVNKGKGRGKGQLSKHSSLAQDTHRVSHAVDESHQAHLGMSQQRAKSSSCSSEGTNRSRWDCKHCSVAIPEAKQGEARPLLLVGLATWNSNSSAVPTEQGPLSTFRHQDRQTEDNQCLQALSPQAFSTSQGIAFLFCWRRRGGFMAGT